MLRCNWLYISSLASIFIGVMLSPVGIGAEENRDQANMTDKPNQDPVILANQFLDRLQTGYESGNISLILSLYNDPVAAVDVTRDENHFYTASSLQAEMEQALAGLTDKKCRFTDRQITTEGDMIMIRTMRSVTANEVPIIANCLMLLVLRKPLMHKEPWDYVITDQILLKEEYVPKSDTGEAPR